MRITSVLAIAGVLGLGTSLYFAYGRPADAERAQTTYFASGRIESKIEYEAGKRQGLAERWLPNGTKVSEGHYEDGRMEGAWQFWNTDGTLNEARSGQYRAGQKLAGDGVQGS